MLVFIKACERSEPATPTLVATSSSLRLLLASLAGSHARFPQGSFASLTHLLELLRVVPRGYPLLDHRLQRVPLPQLEAIILHSVATVEHSVVVLTFQIDSTLHFGVAQLQKPQIRKIVVDTAPSEEGTK